MPHRKHKHLESLGGSSPLCAITIDEMGKSKHNKTLLSYK